MDQVGLGLCPGGHACERVSAAAAAALPSASPQDPQTVTAPTSSLYRAKDEGRGTTCFFEPEMDAQMQARRAMENDMRRAMTAGEFELHFQPIVPGDAGRCNLIKARRAFSLCGSGIVGCT